MSLTLSDLPGLDPAILESGMEVLEFTYHLMYRPGDPETTPIQPGEAPVNLIAEGFSTGPLPAVAWHHPTRTWAWQPNAALEILYLNDHRHRTRRVDRETAEREATRFAAAPLPTPAELTAICRAARSD